MLMNHFENMLDSFGWYGYLIIAGEVLAFVVLFPLFLFGYLVVFCVDVFTSREVGSMEIIRVELPFLPSPTPTREEMRDTEYKAHLMFLLGEGDLTKSGQKKFMEL